VRSHGREEGKEPALRCAVSHATGREELLSAVRAELALLATGIAGSASGQRTAPESTLLVVSPAGGSRFLAEYRDFVSTRSHRAAARCAVRIRDPRSSASGLGRPSPTPTACPMRWATI